MEERKRIDVLLNGLIKENPVLVLVIGTCPTLATSTSVETGFGMGLAATAVLVCSNIVISALHNIIPDKVRIPCFITVIAGFVTIVQMLLQAFVPSLYSALGLYLPLIVVNCIILGRAEMFASKNGIADSALDGIGMGLGFTLTLVIMGSIREIIGNGTWLADFQKDLPVQPAVGHVIHHQEISDLRFYVNHGRSPESIPRTSSPNKTWPRPAYPT